MTIFILNLVFSEKCKEIKSKNKKPRWETFDGERGGCFLVADDAAELVRVADARVTDDEAMDAPVNLRAKPRPLARPRLYGRAHLHQPQWSANTRT